MKATLYLYLLICFSPVVGPAAPPKPATTAIPVEIKTESVKLPRLFCDDMVLQQQTKNTIWGWADPDEAITVKASWGAEGTAKADGQGKWKLFLETPKHGTGHALTISGKTDTIEIKNVAIGEVWLCAGQSNMGWSMGNSFEAEKEATVDLPNLRIFKSSREHWHQPLDIPRDRLSQWKPCDPNSAAETSAVSYYFGKKLHQELGVPVGIIQQAFAGTPIEGWMPWEIQQSDPRALEYRATYDKSAKRQAGSGDTEASALAVWKQELNAYNELIDAGESMKNSVKPLSPPIITKPANLGHQYPAHQFNAMIHPVRPYGIRGAIWYQGERNAKNAPQAAHYRKQLATLIGYYRESWHELSDGNVAKDFPFQFTQLPSWNPTQEKPVEGLEASWVVSRESMRLAKEEIPNTGMAVAIDTGDAFELHPKNKKPIGIRHALLALQQTYGKKFIGSGPTFKGQRIEKRKIILEFESIGSGLKAARSSDDLDSFAIAGEDQQWQWADAKIEGDTVVVSSANVPKPVAVRYAWAMNPSQRNLLYNGEGLPASPFRTDNWPLFDPESEEIVEVFKPNKPDGYEVVDWERPKMIQAGDEGKSAPAQTAAQAATEMEPELADGLAPEVTDLNSKDVSFSREAKLPDLETPYVSTRPNQKEDGIPVAALTRKTTTDRPAILKFAREITAGDHGEVDSFLLMSKGELVFESYFRRGRANFPHYQMSITKSYTAMALGRAIQLGYLTMEDLDKPVVSFLTEIDQTKLVEGAKAITLAEAMNMHSGIRIDEQVAKKLMKNPGQLKGQQQIQAYLEHSGPIPPSPREHKYQGSDPSMIMQVLEAVVPGTAREFIETELLGKMGITNFAWQEDISGLPKSAAGSSMRSRDMMKWGMLIRNGGKWNGEALIPEAFVKKATSKVHTNPQGTSYGFFWWRHDMEVNDRKIECISGRGAGGQFILIFPELDLIAVITAHNKGMGDLLKTFPERVLPGFL